MLQGEVCFSDAVLHDLNARSYVKIMEFYDGSGNRFHFHVVTCFELINDNK